MMETPRSTPPAHDNFYDTTYYTVPKPDPKRQRVHARVKRDENAFYRRLVCPGPGQTLLDVGCGGGKFLEALQDTRASLWGIDISVIATEKAKRRILQPEQIICGSADPLPFPDARFDYVTAWGVIEHFPDPRTLLREMRRVTKPGGTIAVMVPNMYYYKFIWDTARTGAGPVKHQQIESLYAFQEWKALIESAGLTIRATSRHNKFTKPWLRGLRHLLIPFYLSNHFVFLCAR